MVRKEQGTVRVNGMCHSFTGKEQSPRCTKQCLSISSCGGGAIEIREILILSFTLTPFIKLTFCCIWSYCISFTFLVLFYTRSFSNFLDKIMNITGKIKLVITRKNQQSNKHVSNASDIMGKQIKWPQHRSFLLPWQHMGRVTVLEQLTEPAASPRETKATNTVPDLQGTGTFCVALLYSTCCRPDSNKDFLGSTHRQEVSKMILVSGSINSQFAIHQWTTSSC